MIIVWNLNFSSDINDYLTYLHIHIHMYVRPYCVDIQSSMSEPKCKYLYMSCLTWVSVHELFDGQVFVFDPLSWGFPGVRVVVLLICLPGLSLSHSIHLFQGPGIWWFLLHYKMCELYSILQEERLDRKCFTWNIIADNKESMVSKYCKCIIQYWSDPT